MNGNDGVGGAAMAGDFPDSNATAFVDFRLRRGPTVDQPSLPPGPSAGFVPAAGGAASEAFAGRPGTRSGMPVDTPSEIASEYSTSLLDDDTVSSSTPSMAEK